MRNNCKDIYLYIFPDNSFYVGITNNIKRRIKDRKNNNNDSVTKHIIKTGLEPVLIILKRNIEINIAKKLEINYIFIFSKIGFNKLNKNKGGSLGKINLKYTKDFCRKIALKYNTKNEFRKNDYPIYLASIYNNWDSDITIHMIPLKRMKNFWTLENCIKYSKKCKTIYEVEKKYKGAYNVIKKNKWDDLCFTHMVRNINKPNYWTDDRILAEAKKYRKISDFKKNSKGAANASRRKKLNEKVKEIINENKNFIN
jgi:hypothetical protein